ncbi:MAG: cysteine desulfurase family protein [Candidatus Puniceispirillales bacterium WSBS_2018_MAG_OTU23]
MSIYLDYNATAPLRVEARDAMVEALDSKVGGVPANPSSIHHFGQAARLKVETARQHIAELINAKPEEVIFTSGGTEANAMALLRDAPFIITSAIEHVAVLDAVPNAARIAVNGDGVIDLEQLDAAAATAPKDSIISVMAANNETGVIQPLQDVISIAHKHGHLVHSDGVQALGKTPLDFAASGLDLLSLSGHKIGAPSGIGVLVQRQGLQSFPRTYGGGQEKNRRAGTENFLGIVGFGGAALAVLNGGDDMPRLAALHRKFEAIIKAAVPDAKIFGAIAPRLGNTTNISMPFKQTTGQEKTTGRDSAYQIMGFDLSGIAVSAGSACSSGKVKSSHVLMAMGAGDDALTAIRISSGWGNTEHDFDVLAETWMTLYNQT